MEVAAAALQQAGTQTNVALSMLKKNAQAEQAIANMLQQSSASGSRGNNLDITI